MRQIRRDHDLPPDADVIFVEVTVRDPSGTREHAGGARSRAALPLPRPHPRSSSVPNSLAALLLAVRDLTGVTPHIYFEWTEGAPVLNLAKFLLFGLGEVAPTTREVLGAPSRTVTAVRTCTSADASGDGSKTSRV